MSTFLADRQITWAAVAGLILLVAITALYAFNNLVGIGVVVWIDDIGNVLCALAGAVLALLLWRSFGKGESLKTIWGSLGLGLLLWAAGEAIWAFYELVLRQDVPYPSVADALWVIGYIPLFVALYLRYRSLRVPLTSSQWVLAVIIFGVLAVLSGVFVIWPMVSAPGEAAGIEQILNVLYPVGDLVVVLGAVLVFMVLAGGELSWPWGLIAGGFLVLAFSDTLFSYGTWNEIYRPDGMINLFTGVMDVTYIAGYILVALGLFMQARIQRVL